MNLGSMCILLEDLGFQSRSPDTALKTMTYCHYVKSLYEKIFADVDEMWTLEVCCAPEIPTMHIDRWRQQENGIYIITMELSLDIYNPKSIDTAMEFIKETIVMAKTS